MAFSAALKIRTFIAEDWVDFPSSLEYYRTEFQGDNRGFTSSDNVTFRTKQYISFDYNGSNGFSYSADTDTGTTHERTTYLGTGKSTIRSGKADKNTITQQLITRDANKIQIKCICSSKNPRVNFAPAIDYEFYVTLYSNGKIELTGNHDGFPCYEAYVRVNNGSWQTFYQKSQRYITDLAPPAEITANATKQLL